MSSPNSVDFTDLLAEWRKGDKEAGETAIAMVYQELRRLAQYYMQQERSDHTLQATALVHEVYVRLLGETEIEFRDRAHFFQVAGRQMRRILIDHGRALHADKREGDRVKLSLDDARGLTWEHPEDLLALEEALGHLEQFSPRAAQIVELRFFCGLTEKEVADALDISRATIKRDWSFAKAFIYRQLTGEELPEEQAGARGSLKTAAC
jgi:RNA polymerase sigma factor (TIGR02999 family)